MDWETHIELWSRAATKLLDIRQYRVDCGIIPDRDAGHSGFFVVVTQGEAEIHLSGTVYLAQSPLILHGGAGDELRFIPRGNAFGCYLIVYQADFVLPEDQENLLKPYAFTPYTALPLEEKCKTMEHLWQLGTPMDKLEAQAAFLPFVCETMRQMRKSVTENSRPNMAAEAVRYIHEHYRRPITAELLAGIYGCSASYLSRLFKQQIGASPIEYLIHVRIQKSKQLLLQTEARLQDIADTVGYSDVYYFSRLFKKYTGLSPLQYREENRETVQNNPLRLLKSSIATPWHASHNENESYYQYNGGVDISMFRFSRPGFGAMMLLCTALLLSACQAAAPEPASSNTKTAESGQQEKAAAADSTASGKAGKTRVYEHLKGKTEIPAKPKRIVSLFHLGELMALGVKPVGSTTFVLDNPLLKDIEDVEDVGVPPSVEKILSLEPDLIVTTAPFAEVVEGGYDALSKIAPTIVVEQHNDPVKDVAMFGDILGKQEEARRWSEDFLAKTAKSKEAIRPYVGADETFTILNVRANTFFVYGDTNMGGNIIYKYLGLKPAPKVATDVINGETWDISAEVIPDYIGDRLFLTITDGGEEKLKDVNKLIQHSPAGQAGRIYTIDFKTYFSSDPISVEQQMDMIVGLLTGGGR